MPSQKLCEPTSTACGEARNRCISWRFGPCPWISTSMSIPSAPKLSRNCAPTVCSERSVVVSTNVRPPKARAQRPASAATADGWGGSPGFGKRARHEQARIARIVERAAEAQHARFAQARRFGEPAELVVIAQRGRREDPGLGRGQHLLAQRLADIERRFDQPRLMRRDIDPANLRVVGRARELPGQHGEASRPFGQADEIGRQLAHRLERFACRFAGHADGEQRILESMRRRFAPTSAA